MSFQPAARRNAKLRLALSGTAGSGKTYTALQIARLLSSSVAVGDSEKSASQKYAIKAGTEEGPGNWRFSVNTEFEKDPDGYVKMIREAAEAGFEVLVLDSYSHSWIGARDEVDRSTGASKFTSGWKVVSPKVERLVDRILDYPGHVIATLRSKAEYALEKDEKTGRTAPRKIGMATIAREGTDYEFDIMLDLTPDGSLTVTKTRCDALPMGRTFQREDIPRIVKTLKNWLDEGTPLSAVETLGARIRSASAQADLDALRPALNACTPDERRALKPAYEAKKAEFAAVTELDGEL